jgi:hypothetical protein
MMPSDLKQAQAKPARCPVCDDVIAEGAGVERDGKIFCTTWHAEQYHPPLPWWRRIWKGGPVDDKAGRCF